MSPDGAGRDRRAGGPASRRAPGRAHHHRRERCGLPAGRAVARPRHLPAPRGGARRRAGGPAPGDRERRRLPVHPSGHRPPGARRADRVTAAGGASLAGPGARAGAPAGGAARPAPGSSRVMPSAVGEPELAYRYALLAAERSVARYAHTEALGWLDLAAASARTPEQAQAVDRLTADLVESAGWSEAPQRFGGAARDAGNRARGPRSTRARVRRVINWRPRAAEQDATMAIRYAVRVVQLGSAALLMGAACDGLRLPARPANTTTVAETPSPPAPKPNRAPKRVAKVDPAFDADRFDAIRRGLRRLVVAEETYYAENGVYTEDLARIGFTPEKDTEVRFLWLARTGWAASGTHPGMPGRDCVIYVGRAHGPPTTLRDVRSGREGVPVCDASPRARVASVAPTPAVAAEPPARRRRQLRRARRPPQRPTPAARSTRSTRRSRCGSISETSCAPRTPTSAPRASIPGGPSRSRCSISGTGACTITILSANDAILVGPRHPRLPAGQELRHLARARCRSGRSPRARSACPSSRARPAATTRRPRSQPRQLSPPRPRRSAPPSSPPESPAPSRRAGGRPGPARSVRAPGRSPRR